MNQKLTLVATFLLVSFFSCAQEYKNLVFSPSKPKPGDVIRFEYSTAGTELGDAIAFEAVAYIYDGQLRAQETKLIASGDKWKGEISTNDSTKAVFIIFKKDKLTDNNREQGYSLMLYNKKGEPVKGAYAAIAEINNGVGSFIMRLKTDPAKDLELFDKEFSRHSDLKSKMLVSYTGLQVRIDKATAKEKMEPLISEVNSWKKKTEADYQTIMWTYQRLDDKEKADIIKAAIIKNFPNGAQVKSDKVTAFHNERDLTKREALMNAYIREYPVSTDADKKTVGDLYSSMASAAAIKMDWDMLKKYEAVATNKETLIGAYNHIALALAGEGLDGEAKDLTRAKELSGKSLQYLKESMTNPDAKPSFYTESEHKRNLQNAYTMFSDTYAMILWKSGEKEEAFKYQEEAVKNMGGSNTAVNERFIIYKSKLKGLAAVKNDIEGYIKEGKSSPKLKEILKESYIKEGNSDAGFDTYVEGLIKEYRAKLREDLMKKMISEAAPKFALKDLSGNMISLDDLKGKVVVVDFWATWCGPCKASFPGMQQALNKYKNDPDVKFVFIDTWESKKSEEMQKKAGEFITKNKYDFQVLLDTEDKMVTNYAVESIPTKFVIDPQSKIRFKSIGFDGSSDKLVDEISIMVDVLKPGR
jgi:thiol-disulfide isomerase/thioredoxin